MRKIGAGIPFQKAATLDNFDWLVALIKTLRPDLRKLFNSANGISLNMAKWLVTSGAREYKILSENDSFQNILSTPLKILGISPLEALVYNERPDVRKSFPLPEQKDDFRQWFYIHGVDEHGLLDFLNEEGKRRYFAAHPDKSAEAIISPRTISERPFGANLVGYAYGQLGIGEDLRMTARALQAAGVPFTIINFPPGKDIPQNDRSMAEFVGDGAPYKFNIFCMTALETGRFYAEKGSEIFQNHYNIGYWPWELAKWPQEWLEMTDLVHEAWVSSRHIYDALAPVSPAPVLIMPLAVDIGEISNLSRTDFNLPEKAYLFYFSFDFNSSIHRKNPQACLKAFQRAFPPGAEGGKPVGLVIKCHQPKNENRYWNKLKEAARQDSRIHIVEATLPRPDLMALCQCCDCFLSLHRAEGFGRGIAEALLLGLRVIATGYSGNVDYCRDNPQACLVRHKLAPVPDGQYPFGDGQMWAEADIGDAARLMALAPDNAAAADQKIHDLVGLKAAGKRFKRRLRYLARFMGKCGQFE